MAFRDRVTQGRPDPLDRRDWGDYGKEQTGASTGGGGCQDGWVETMINADGDFVYSATPDCVPPDEAQRRSKLQEQKYGQQGGTEGQPAAGGIPAAVPVPAGAPKYNFPPVPQFNGPSFRWDEQFAWPTPDQALNDPGYQFRLKEGQRALEQSAAGKGTLRTGGTLKDILNYGQSAASQEYDNVANRYLTGYKTRYDTAADIYGKNYQLAKDQFSPNLFEWDKKTAFGADAAKLAFDAAWKKYFHDTVSADTLYQSGLPRG